MRNVILSGYFDSIGIYQAVSDRQRKLAQQWLDILGIDKRTADAPFHSLSWGQQRLALIVRALVKHPTVLILDEPLQGLDPLNRQLVRRFVDVLLRQERPNCCSFPIMQRMRRPVLPTGWSLYQRAITIAIGNLHYLTLPGRVKRPFSCFFR